MWSLLVDMVPNVRENDAAVVHDDNGGNRPECREPPTAVLGPFHSDSFQPAAWPNYRRQYSRSGDVLLSAAKPVSGGQTAKNA